MLRLGQQPQAVLLDQGFPIADHRRAGPAAGVAELGQVLQRCVQDLPLQPPPAGGMIAPDLGEQARDLLGGRCRSQGREQPRLGGLGSIDGALHAQLASMGAPPWLRDNMAGSLRRWTLGMNRSRTRRKFGISPAGAGL